MGKISIVEEEQDAHKQQQQQQVKREEKEKEKVEEEQQQFNVLTKADVVSICLKHGFYKTPSCNDKLYLHHRGLESLGDALAEYTECKCLWLESNCLRSVEIDRLAPMGKELKQLYLHQNVIGEMPSSWEQLPVLHTLNLSDNCLQGVRGFRVGETDAEEEGKEEVKEKKGDEKTEEDEEKNEADVDVDDEGEATSGRFRDLPICDALETLQLKNNRIKDTKRLRQLLALRKLSTLDLSHNKIEDGEELVALLSQIKPGLKSVYLQGNPCVRTIRNYRKTIIAKCPLLRYLDDRPVFDDERRLVTAWARGGAEAEKLERDAMRAEEEQKLQRRLDEFRSFTKKGDNAIAQRKDNPGPAELKSKTEERCNDDDGDDSASSSDEDDGEDWSEDEKNEEGEKAAAAGGSPRVLSCNEKAECVDVKRSAPAAVDGPRGALASPTARVAGRDEEAKEEEEEVVSRKNKKKGAGAAAAAAQRQHVDPTADSTQADSSNVNDDGDAQKKKEEAIAKAKRQAAFTQRWEGKDSGGNNSVGDDDDDDDIYVPTS